MSPLSHKLEEFTHFSERFPQITPNMISFLGVVVAFVSSKVVINQSLVIRRVAVFIFLLRQLLDDLDGLVARIRLGLDKTKELSLTGTNGYLVDGFCDAVGFTMFLIAVFVQLKQRFNRKASNNLSKYQLLSEISVEKTISDSKLSDNTISSMTATSAISAYDQNTRQLFRLHLMFGLQLLLSSILWNRYIDKYHTILETDLNPIKLEIFKSRIQWIIMWFWRCFGNAHQLMGFFLLSVWFNKTVDFLKFVHFYGFLTIILLSFLTEIHLNDVNIT